MGEDNMTLGYLMGQESNNKNGGFFGGDDGWLGLIVLVALLGGGFGGFGGFGGGGGIQSAFTLNNLESAVRGVQQGICDSTYALNNSIMSGFHGVDNAVCNLGFNMQQGFNNLSYQNQNCCCETQRLIERGFCDLGNAVSNQTRDLTENQNANTRQIMDFLVNSKIEGLQAENQALRFSASQDRQNAYITTAMQAQTDQLIQRIAPYPVPSYTVPAPYPYGYSGYGWNSGCGCGCG